jgi:hypothetical protein
MNGPDMLQKFACRLEAVCRAGIACLALLVAGSAMADASLPAPAGNFARQCNGLAAKPIDGTLVSHAFAVADDATLPAHCRVQGVIEPAIRFEARLPLAGWNGKYFQAGCGGYCGAVLPDRPGFANGINEALKLGYATITTDSGHAADMGDASWAEGNPQAVEVFAHRGIALTHRAGTALTRAFYARDPERSYFSGCSNGGRMAAMAAQRYPDLFDGILGGAPVLELSRNGGVYGSWVVQANTRPDGARILTRTNFAHKLPSLEAAVLAQCDAADGKTDGLITRPRDCRLDLSALPACGEDDAPDCFTGEQRAVLARWYQGPQDSAGRALYPGMPPGSERYWLAWFLDTEDAVARGNALGGDYARYLGFADGVPPQWTALDFDFDDDPERLAHTARLLDAVQPDLGAFRDAGGKFLMWHGWADPLVLPDQSVSYYRRVAEHLGGLGEVRTFFRLFMIPGHGHCWELPSDVPDRFNPIRVLEDWVERGVAPEMIPAAPADPASARASLVALCPYPADAVALESPQSIGEIVCGSLERAVD